MVDVVGKFGSIVRSQRSNIHFLLIALILINWAPTEVLGRDLNSKLNSTLGPLLTPVKSVMNNIFVRTLLWLVLLYSCCFSNELNTFFLISIYFLMVH